MTFKVIVFTCLVSAVFAGIIQEKPNHGWQAVEERPANYAFEYSVNNPPTGDIKSQREEAVDGVVTGQYSLVDPDGYRRIVDYTADKTNGFQASVRREKIEDWTSTQAPPTWQPEPDHSNHWKPQPKPWENKPIQFQPQPKWQK
jgi:hypothetical protein